MKKKEDLNRLKVVLAERSAPINGWQENLIVTKHNLQMVHKYSTTSIGGVDKHIKNIKCRY